jgi:peptidoglycan/xylan/chitin deacetylase (PgdA/CDA1 family)
MRVLPGGVPRGTPTLTFDDGPAKDTEALLDVLARHRVTATFFLVGERAARVAA